MRHQTQDKVQVVSSSRVCIGGNVLGQQQPALPQLQGRAAKRRCPLQRTGLEAVAGHLPSYLDIPNGSLRLTTTARPLSRLRLPLDLGSGDNHYVPLDLALRIEASLAKRQRLRLRWMHVALGDGVTSELWEQALRQVASRLRGLCVTQSCDVRIIKIMLNALALGECPQLHTLVLNTNHNTACLTGMLSLAACASLHTLNLNGCTGMRDVSSLVTRSDVSSLAACTSLHTLDLSGCTRLSDVSSLAPCTSLTTLTLRLPSRVSDVSLLAA